MKQIILCGILFLCTMASADPPRPNISSICAFNYSSVVMGDEKQPTVHGTFGLMYTKNETKRMQLFNQTQVVNGTIRRRDYSLERMDTGKEYSIDYNSQSTVAGPPCACVYDDAYVENLWSDIESYEFNRTITTKNNKTLNIWTYEVVDNVQLEIGVEEGHPNIPVTYGETTKQRNKVIKVVYRISNFTTTPDRNMFRPPKVCSDQSTCAVMINKQRRAYTIRKPFFGF